MIPEEAVTITNENIVILGVGNILFSDEGLGIRVLEKLMAGYEFPENVTLEDGGVLGMNLLGVISEADHLIVIDAVKNRGMPGDLYRIEGEDIPQRILAKNSLHQIDLLETLTLCKALDKSPETVILGAEPQDIDTLSLELTDTLQKTTEDLSRMVLAELERLGAAYHVKEKSTSCA